MVLGWATVRVYRLRRVIYPPDDATGQLNLAIPPWVGAITILAMFNAKEENEWWRSDAFLSLKLSAYSLLVVTASFTQWVTSLFDLSWANSLIESQV